MSTSLSLSLFQWSTLQKQTPESLKLRAAVLPGRSGEQVTHSASSQTLSTSPSSEDRATLLMSLTACSMVPGWDHHNRNQPVNHPPHHHPRTTLLHPNSPWRRSSPSLWPGWLGCGHGKASASAAGGSRPPRLRARGVVRPPAAWRRPRPPPRSPRGAGWQRRGSRAPPCRWAGAWCGGASPRNQARRGPSGAADAPMMFWLWEQWGSVRAPRSFLLKGHVMFLMQTGKWILWESIKIQSLDWCVCCF